MLTAKQQAFIEAYLICLDAKAAAERAGYGLRAAKQQGSRLLKDPKVAAAIEAGTAARTRANVATADRVIAELARIAFFDIRKLFTPAGHLITPRDLDDDTAAAVGSIEVVSRQRPGQGEDGAAEVEYVHKIKTVDKNAALTNLGRHFALFTDKTELTGRDGGPVEVDNTTAAARIAALLEAARARKAADEGG